MHKIAINIKVVLFSCTEKSVLVFLHKDALPKGEPLIDESIDGAVKRIVQKTAGIQLKDDYIEQLYTYSSLEKGIRQVTVTYYVLIPYFCFHDSAYSFWHELSHVKIIHAEKKIIDYAVQRLQWKLEYTNVVYSLLQEQFTLGDLQRIYEAILNKSLDKRNFRKKILSLKLLKPTSSIRKGEKSRPARLYSFIKRHPVITNIFS
ncbi:MAG: NUDIX hydrolase [Candidatus Gottesmanbacteria bacterium GW2011_GWA2_44_17]|uniref:NUDIX hydrolase n=1 Tax=Candidatus Gottesmanbacteria bacterium GW2011_GWA2_44_17 TaxID=1618444 RepID=A0A0G1HKA1_9BACT|nr:MAG: NUDIX hydrolase [Candidatus Gottesmanbacteria bacterium GW2011_GWA2_44_17]